MNEKEEICSDMAFKELEYEKSQKNQANQVKHSNIKIRRVWTGNSQKKSKLLININC